jgi:hypothetical protein
MRFPDSQTAGFIKITRFEKEIPTECPPLSGGRLVDEVVTDDPYKEKENEV